MDLYITYDYNVSSVVWTPIEGVYFVKFAGGMDAKEEPPVVVTRHGSGSAAESDLTPTKTFGSTSSARLRHPIEDARRTGHLLRDVVADDLRIEFLHLDRPPFLGD